MFGIGGGETTTFGTFALVTNVTLLLLLVFCYFMPAKVFHKPENIYLIFGIILGMIYLIIIPPYSTPDEEVHINSAYHVSNLMMGKSSALEGAGTISKRVCEANLAFSGQVNDASYTYTLEGLKQGAYDNTYVDVGGTVTGYTYLYLACGLGVTVGRILHLGGMATLLLGAWFNSLFFVLCMYYAIKKIPFAKMALAGICLMPMVLQQTSSYSYDCTIIAVSLLSTALAFKYAYGKEPMKKSEYAVYFIATLAMLLCKGGVYVFLAFLPVWLTLFRQKPNKKIILSVAGYFLAIVAVFFRGKIFGLFGGQATGATITDVVAAEGTNTYYSLGTLIHEPGTLFRIFFDTWKIYRDNYIETTIGSHLGWMVVGIPWLYLLGFIFVILLGVQHVKGESYGVTKMDRIGLWGVTGAVILSCMLAMLISWTPVGSITIEGVQGRYFLPAALAFTMAFRNSSISIRRRIDQELFFSIGVVQLLVINEVLAVAFNKV